METGVLKATLIDTMGDDLKVVNAARVSFGKHKSELDDQDEKLIKYLAGHDHWTPFAHCQATFLIEAPIFVRSQLAKHTVGLVMNEVSRRYIVTEPVLYFPISWRSAPTNKKQGSGPPMPLPSKLDNQFHTYMRDALALYNSMIKAGVAPEMARMVLPQNTMTEWYWTGSLAAFARVCNLRLPPDAQHETRLIAAQIFIKLKAKFPLSMAALSKYTN